MPLISITFLKMLKVKVGNENMSFMTLNLLSHNNYCSVGVMEICLLNLLILIDCFCVILMLVCSLRACHMWLTRNHMFKREIWGQFTSFIFWNFQISLVSFRRFHNFKKVSAVNLSQISFLNMWLAVLIPWKKVLQIAISYW